MLSMAPMRRARKCALDWRDFPCKSVVSMEPSLFHGMPMSDRAVRVMLVTCLVYAMSAQGAEPCDAVNEAMLKLARTPNHSFTESRGAVAGGKVQLTERIATASAAYVLLSGKWHKSVVTPQQELQTREETLREKKNMSCRYLRDEVIEGEPAALYSTHDEGDGGKADSQIWVSRARGLPVKRVIHLSAPDGTIGESQITTRYEYDNARAPEGAQ
jgi:hypothetical protein